METTDAPRAPAAKGGFHQVGFHPTGLIGTFGCTLAAARLLALDTRDRRCRRRASRFPSRSGSLEFLNDGAWTKRLHPGWAGARRHHRRHAGEERLRRHRAPRTRAASGCTSSHLGPLADACDLGLVTAGLGEVWETNNVAIKPVPACHFTHACADAASLLPRTGTTPR
jgi:hypothetical protein